MLTLKTYAKVNLVLEVLGRREDGYHEIASVMQTIGLYDVLTFEVAKEIEFSCSVQELQTNDNLVFKAVRALHEATGRKTGARIALEKKIPLAAGLGGGSSDAAAVLKGLNNLWNLGLTSEKLAEIGAGIGSDVPFFIYGGTCLAEGRGEKITPLTDIRKAWFILLKPDITIPMNKTAALYRMLKPGHYTESGLASGAADLLKKSETEAGICYNTFDSLAAEAYNGLERYWEVLKNAGAREIHLAGSGPLLFSMFDSLQDAVDVQVNLDMINIDSIVVPSVTRDETGY